ncbi:uncharacterized protein LOC132756091 isoform X1 [Ruditapes philippinarum]|uniref:uncharacterized protein LOC132756091 isoform X1 n=1 Tax=Ruditapes philippinarum TaxID=129788 RepID=UPI00295BCFCF|nr:uncharacterized protein LOC132756091 isoform X1 [Ruditapes philippinarum]
MELNNHYGDSDTAKEIYTDIASEYIRTKQDRIYDALQHGTGEHADKTTPSAKKCTPLLLWCTLVNSILIGLLIIAVSVSLYMSTNVSKASNSKGATVTGIWKNWSVWSPCNAKCGQGFKWRIRTCTSVSPKDNGFDCNGNGTETVQCQNSECSADLQKLVTTLSQKFDKLEHAQRQIQTEVVQNLTNILNKATDLQKLMTTLSQKIDKLEHTQGQIQTEVDQKLTSILSKTNVLVGFAVSNPDTSSSSALKFKNVIYNSGDGYSLYSGVFTCRHPGLYFFTATIFRSSGAREVACDFHVNGVSKLVVNTGNAANDGFQSGSGSFVYRLDAGDIVVLSNCFKQAYIHQYSSFTGFRVSFN